MEKFLMSIKLKQSPKRKHRLLYIPNYINESRNNKILDSNKISKTHLDSHTLLRTTTMNQSTIDNISNIHNNERSLTSYHENNNLKFKKKIKELITEVSKKKEMIQLIIIMNQLQKFQSKKKIIH